MKDVVEGACFSELAQVRVFLRVGIDRGEEEIAEGVEVQSKVDVRPLRDEVAD